MQSDVQNPPSGATPHRKSAFGPHRIFVSYRRSDTEPWAGRLTEDLRRHFGRERVFRDVDSGRPTLDYRRVIDEVLSESRVVVALLGPQWASCAGSNGRPRIWDEDDLVRIELERALAAGIPILPVFVGGAAMPKANELPPSLHSFPAIHGMRLTDEGWPYDLGRVLERLEAIGMVPPVSAPDDDPEAFTARVGRALLQVQRYQRTFVATRPRTYRAVVGASEALRYQRLQDDPEGALVRFQIYRRDVVVKILEDGPGRSKVIIELTSARTGALFGSAAASIALGPVGMMAAVGGVTLRAFDRRFAAGFLDNVQRVLDGRGVGEDSSLPPGVERWRNRKREI